NEHDPIHQNSSPTRRSSDLDAELVAWQLMVVDLGQPLKIDRAQARAHALLQDWREATVGHCHWRCGLAPPPPGYSQSMSRPSNRSEEHTSELQSRENLVSCL